MAPENLTDAQRQFLDAQRLASAGRGKCRRCKHELPLNDLITVNFGGSLVFCVCPSCFDKVDITMARDVNGIRVEVRPRGIVIVG